MSRKLSIVGYLLPVIIPFIIQSCGGGGNPVPKPRGYYRIDVEEKAYQIFDSIGFPYTFEYPTYGKVVPIDKKGEVFWINLSFPAYNATIYLSYKQVQNNLAALIEDSHKLSYKHVAKADAISESRVTREAAKVFGLLTEVDGDAASPIQFFITDSVKNFLYGSLYFNSVPNADSLAPLVTYFNEDVLHLLKTVEWKKVK